MNGLPEMIDVKSSHIAKLGHKGNKLFVRFQSGHTFTYDGVPPELYREGLQSESVGKWFHSKIKKNFVHKKHDV